MPKISQFWDRGFVGLTAVCALATGGLLLAIISILLEQATPAMGAFGWGFLVSHVWNPVQGQYGIWPQVWGTLCTTGTALVLAVPLGLAVAIGLTESWPHISPEWQGVAAAVVEVLAAIPSVVYGLWGIFILIPTLRTGQKLLPQIFGAGAIGPSVGVASLVLSIMILPTVAAVARSSLRQVPQEYRWAAMAVGATRWETLLAIILPAARAGIGGGILLALARALGETMAVTMLIGNANRVSTSLWQAGSTIPSLLANQFAEAQGMQVAALMYAALVLLGLTVLVQLVARLGVGNEVG
ncbi:phosphate ABC transporter permease [Gloeomargarita lithophora Alchichica-D10]|uniref:Phosphate transport system permease protein n=1 Tax=Gloeomargarita lithophora Alchichica-D10 TaxID=1188229 RepID=A0A1J0AD88_9CYAN|nr:phosphate ABC transporter permease subunit PstC [Gloeomargarita lithophora]APB33910.1 phosphate ABC transporter permease [Gloeomargarita lithophora Alchichica-D10]